MPVVKVSEATGVVLDWMVGEVEFRRFQAQGSNVKAWGLEDHKKGLRTDPYSTDWLRAGDIIDCEKIDCVADPNGKDVWMSQLYATRLAGEKVIRTYGPTPLIAAMRCYVASKLGEEVEVPDELT